ncbi:MAG: HEAT repeat domain-containing protein, partial [Phycisphaerales bacterium]|nr:HEAT repeat domain-containing protein [Phycisphaerales bacterium]
PESVGPLLSRLRDDGETTDVRVAVARALGQYPGDRAFQGLIAALNKRELALNRAALDSLTTMTGEDFGLDANAWRAWYEQPDVGADRAFANGTEYLYPVYDRDISLLERIAFWSTPHFETPAPPAGLRPENERRTYDDSGNDEES